MVADQNFFRNIIGKSVISKTGKRYGVVGDLVFEIRTGELIHFILDKPTPHVEDRNLEKGKEGEILIPFSAVTASEDFVIISEEDMA
jgi:sporulation protein YlmC with PRC-barrel domain